MTANLSGYAMGHRANFVILQSGVARAFFDPWAALGSTHGFALGPEHATRAAEAAEPTEELLDWAFAEAGYLIDHDQKVAMVFGVPESGIDVADLEGLEGVDMGDLAVAGATDAALAEGPERFLELISPVWRGWSLWWDDRGVDAFAEHLQVRSITTITTQPSSSPPESRVFRRRA
ncbi:MAG: hypothetical protein AAGN66_16570 [Acidobacteriota bacterium]